MKFPIATAASAVLLVAGALTLMPAAAHALTTKECSAKYKAAKAANTLGGKSWNDFRKSDCGAVDAADAAPAKKSESKPPMPQVVAGPATFPTAISAKYASETPYKARLHTCAEQYKANKASNANGGLRWIMKGGGYWSECNKKLKAVKA